jgi:hypothetical protein
MSEHLRIALTDEMATQAFKLAPQLTVVVNLPILERDNLILPAEEGLPPAFQINYRQTPHRHPDRAFYVMTFAVGTSAHHYIAHGCE